MSATECFASDQIGLYGSAEPGGGDSAWTTLIADQPGGLGGILGLSCPTTTRCLAVNNEGYAAIGSPPATGSQIRSMLRTLIPGRKVTRAQLQHGYDFSVDMPSGGQLMLTWYGRYHGHRRIIATTTGPATSNAGPIRVTVNLTRIGRSLIRSRQPIHPTADNTFIALDGTGTTYATSTQFTIPAASRH